MVAGSARTGCNIRMRRISVSIFTSTLSNGTRVTGDADVIPLTHHQRAVSVFKVYIILAR
eukprot:9490463-Pyramimonas_sp.AAC.1